MVAVIVFMLGFNSGSFESRWSAFFGGNFGDVAVWQMIAGVVVALIALKLLVFPSGVKNVEA